MPAAEYARVLEDTLRVVKDIRSLDACWDDDPATPCPVSQAANDRYRSLAMPGPPPGARATGTPSARTAAAVVSAAVSRREERLEGVETTGPPNLPPLSARVPACAPSNEPILPLFR